VAESIRGINIVIGAETTALTAALREVNQQGRNTQSELAQVQRLLRMDPGNISLIRQQQQLLASAVENSREKLLALRAAEQQVRDQFARGEISQGQMRAFEREIAAAEQALRGFERQAGESRNTIADLARAAGETGEKMKGVGEKMSIGITAPIVAAGGVMLKGAIDAENATGKLQAQLGLTAEEAADLGAVARAVWVNGFGENISEANEAIKEVRMNMGTLAEDDLQKVTEGAMTIADLFQADVKESTAAAGVMMKNFGLDGQSALDLITVGFQKGGDFTGELLDTIREYSPQFATMGMSADQMLGILISGAQAGAFNLDKVGDAVKEFNIRAQDGSKTTAEGFAAIGLNADQMGQAIAQGGEKGQQAFTATIAALAAMEDPLAQDAAGVALFGTQWEDIRAKVIVAMADGIDSLGSFQGATDAAAAAVYDNNPGLALTTAMRKLQAAIGPALLPLADIIKNTVVPAVKELADWFNNLSPGGQKAALAIAGIAAAIGPALMLIGGMATGFTSVVGIATKLTGVLTTLIPKIASLVLGLGPIGIAIAAIVAAGVLLYMNWDTIKAKANELGNKLGEVWEGIKSATSAAWENIKSTITEMWQAAVNVFYKYHPIGIIISQWDEIKSYFNELASQAVSWGQNIVQGMIDGITGFIGRAVAAASNLADKISATVKNILGIASPSIVMKEFGRMVAEGLAKGIEENSNKAITNAQLLANAIKNVAGTMVNNLSRAMEITTREFKLQELQLGVNASEAARLILRKQQLAAELDNTMRQVNVLTIAYEEMAKAQGENSEEAIELKKQLLDAKIKMLEYSNGIVEANLNIEESANRAKESVGGMAREVSDEVASAMNRIAELERQVDARRAEKAELDREAENDERTKKKHAKIEENVKDEFAEKINSDARLAQMIVDAGGDYSALSEISNPLGAAVSGKSVDEAKDIALKSAKYRIESAIKGVEKYIGYRDSQSEDDQYKYKIANRKVLGYGYASMEDYIAHLRSIIPLAKGGIAMRPVLAAIAERGGPEAVIPLDRIQPLLAGALLNAVKNLTASSVRNELHVHIENRGTIVGRNGIEEFADKVSGRIAGKYGLAIGGAW